MVALVRALHAAGEEAAEHALVVGVARVHEAIDALPAEVLAILEPGDLPILHFVAEVALAPRQLDRACVQFLRSEGLSDLAVHDVVHVVCCFSYMNRLADSLGVGLVGAERLRWAETLFGADAVARHTGWADKGLPPGAADA